MLRLLLLLIVFTAVRLEADDSRLIVGVVIDSETTKPIPGATVRLVSTNKGTYTNSLGKFRLSLPSGKQILRVSSIGYETLKVNLQDKNDTIRIQLKPSSVSTESVEVTGEISADQIISRAIRQKKENLSRLKTFSGLLYSKLTLELGGSLISESGEGSLSISLPFLSGDKDKKKTDDSYKLFVMETFSRSYIDFPKKVNHSTIIQRRQTANIPAQNNILALGNYQNFYENRLDIVNAVFATPLADDAFDFYRYELLARTKIDDRYVYVIKVEPTTTTFPAFRGTIKIIENTYNLIEVDLYPSKESAISFIEDMHYIQKFEEIKQNIWYPTYLDLKGKAKVELIGDYADFRADLNAVSIFSEMTANEALPDSIYNIEIPRITVSPKADTSDSYFWERNSLRDISQKELDIYRRVDSAYALRDSVKKSAEAFDYSILPFIDFNRVSSVSLGLSPEFTLYDFAFNGDVYYSFGEQDWLGEAFLSLIVPFSKNTYFALQAGTFARISEMSNNYSYSRLINSAIAALTHTDYYNYYRQEGYEAGADINYKDYRLWSNFEYSRHFSRSNSTDKSLFFEKPFRSNPLAERGEYRLLELGLQKESSFPIMFNDDFDYAMDVHLFYGEQADKCRMYRSADAKFDISIPTFSTGYSSMKLDLTIAAGVQSENTPLQYRFSLNPTMFVLDKSGTFLTAEEGKYGGTEFVSLNLSFNTRDLLWRAIGLPLWQGRGLELIFGGATAKYNNPDDKIYTSTGNTPFSEVGFGIGRIPSFFNNILFFETNFRWGVSPNNKKRFGWAIGLSSPL